MDPTLSHMDSGDFLYFPSHIDCWLPYVPILGTWAEMYLHHLFWAELPPYQIHVLKSFRMG